VRVRVPRASFLEANTRIKQEMADIPRAWVTLKEIAADPARTLAVSGSGPRGQRSTRPRGLSVLPISAPPAK
jgi:hypothetical protein